jgi:hypothetical protein
MNRLLVSCRVVMDVRNTPMGLVLSVCVQTVYKKEVKPRVCWGKMATLTGIEPVPLP